MTPSITSAARLLASGSALQIKGPLSRNARQRPFFAPGSLGVLLGLCHCRYYSTPWSLLTSSPTVSAACGPPTHARQPGWVQRPSSYVVLDQQRVKVLWKSHRSSSLLC